MKRLPVCILAKPTFVYNLVGLERTTVAAAQALPPCNATIILDFAYDGGGLGKGATATLLVNGKQAGQKRIARTTAGVFSLDEGADVGIDEDTPVTEDYEAGPKSRFTGKIGKVTIEVKPMPPLDRASAEKAAAEAAEREAAQD